MSAGWLWISCMSAANSEDGLSPAAMSSICNHHEAHMRWTSLWIKALRKKGLWSREVIWTCKIQVVFQVSFNKLKKSCLTWLLFLVTLFACSQAAHFWKNESLFLWHEVLLQPPHDTKQSRYAWLRPLGSSWPLFEMIAWSWRNSAPLSWCNSCFHFQLNGFPH